MTGGFLITFREGLEAFLVVGIILSYLARCGMKKYNKWVYIGVALGTLSAFFTGLIFQIYYSGFESRIGEHYLKIGIMATAIIVLTYMVLWMSKKGHSIKGELENDLADIITAGSVVSLILMGYLAILREGFETVLFLGALYGSSMDASTYYGGLFGLLAAFFVTISIFKGMRNVPLKRFFTITGWAIMLISAGLIINMIGLMQDLQIVPVLKAGIFDLSWLMIDSSNIGIFFKALFGYTHRPSLIQFFSYLIYIGFVFSFLNSNKRLVRQNGRA